MTSRGAMKADRILRIEIEKALARDMLVSEIMAKFFVSYEYVYGIKRDLETMEYKQQRHSPRESSKVS